jgi:uncharacterized protein with PQ loop repeat
MDALKSAIQPLTHNLPQPIADVGISLLGPQCYKTLIYNVDLTATDCVKLAISKGLGIGIIGASSIVKIPQLLKLLNSQSADGLSFLSYLLESSSYLISLAYNVRRGFPFSTYGETALILVQNIAIASLVLKYSGRGVAVAGWIGGLAVAGAALFNEQWVDAEKMSLLQATAGVLGVASKVPQIFTVWSEGGTGQLSAFAVSCCFYITEVDFVTNMLCVRAGCQLPPWFPFSHLYYPSGSRRSAYLVRLHRWFCAQRHSLLPGRLLLERARVQEDGVEEVGEARCGRQEGNGARRLEWSDAVVCECRG